MLQLHVHLISTLTVLTVWSPNKVAFTVFFFSSFFLLFLKSPVDRRDHWQNCLMLANSIINITSFLPSPRLSLFSVSLPILLYVSSSPSASLPLPLLPLLLLFGISRKKLCFSKAGRKTCGYPRIKNNPKAENQQETEEDMEEVIRICWAARRWCLILNDISEFHPKIRLLLKQSIMIKGQGKEAVSESIMVFKKCRIFIQQ